MSTIAERKASLTGIQSSNTAAPNNNTPASVAKINHDLEINLKSVHIPMAAIKRRLKLWMLTEGFLFQTPQQLDAQHFAREIEKTNDDALISLALMDIPALNDWSDMITVLRSCEQMFEDKVTDERVAVEFTAHLTPKQKKWGSNAGSKSEPISVDLSLMQDEAVESTFTKVRTLLLHEFSINYCVRLDFQIVQISSIPDIEIKELFGKLCSTEVISVKWVNLLCFVITFVYLETSMAASCSPDERRFMVLRANNFGKKRMPREKSPLNN